MSIPLFEICFNDDTLYEGGDIVDPKWRESPDKPIRAMRLRLPSGDFLFVGGYEEYNFFIEAMLHVYGGGKGSRPTFIFLMGLDNGVITSYRIAISDYKQYKAGDMTIRRFPKGKEYDGKPTSGWHTGIAKSITKGG